MSESLYDKYWKQLKKTGIKVQKSDIHWLAREWNDLMRAWEYATTGQAMTVVNKLVQAYCRGQGQRTGNMSAWERYHEGQTLLPMTVMAYISETESYMFEMLRNKFSLVGEDGIDSFVKRLYSKQREERLDV